jgi:hypothetical protein
MIRFRTLFMIMAILSILLILSPFILGLVSAAFSYHGKCYGFTDGSWDCSWQEYASDQIFWSGLLIIPLGLYILPGWITALGLWLVGQRTPNPDRIPLAWVILIPLGGSLGGICFSIFPVFIRLFSGTYR